MGKMEARMMLICAVVVVSLFTKAFGVITMTTLPIVNIHEDTQIETNLIKVECTDTTSTTGTGFCPICNIQTMRPTDGPFRVWKKYGYDEFHVYYVGGAASAGLDWDITRTYNLTIQCTSEDGVDTGTVILEIDVQPNQPPAILNTVGASTNLDAFITQVGDVVFDIDVSDNESDPITYTLYTEPAVDYFDIRQSDGVISVVKDLRTAVEGYVNIRVNVSDGHSTSGPYTVQVSIANLNARPTFTNAPTNVSVYENLAPGTNIFQFAYTEDYYQTSVSPVCTVIPENENYIFNFIYSVQNRITVELSTLTTSTQGDLLDAERTTYYNISCLLNDGYLDSVGGYINLFINNINEPPVFNDDLYYCVMNENYQFIGPCDLTGLSVTDPESDDIIEYKLLTGNNSERFRYDNAKKELAFNVDYDVDTGFSNSVRLTVAAVDSTFQTGTAQIQVNVVDVNDNSPVFNFGAGSNTYSVTQGDSVGALGRLTATDADLTSPNNDVTFQAIGGTFSEYVTVLGNGEVIYSKQFPDTFSGQSQVVYVEARDGGSPVKSATGTVVVSFVTTTSTTTTTTTTSTTTTTTTTTTTATPGFFDVTANVVLFSILMFLLFLLLLVALYFLLRYCQQGYCFRPTRGPKGRNTSLCGDGDCDDCFKPSRPEPKRPRVPAIREPNANYRDPFWKTNDNYERGVVTQMF